MKSDVEEFGLKIQKRLDVLAETIIRRVSCVADLESPRSIAAVRGEVQRMKSELQAQLKGEING